MIADIKVLSDEKVLDKTLGKTQGLILGFLRSEPDVTICMMLERLFISEYDIRKNLKVLEVTCDIVREGSRKTERWKVYELEKNFSLWGE